MGACLFHNNIKLNMVVRLLNWLINRMYTVCLYAPHIVTKYMIPSLDALSAAIAKCAGRIATVESTSGTNTEKLLNENGTVMTFFGFLILSVKIIKIPGLLWQFSSRPNVWLTSVVAWRKGQVIRGQDITHILSFYVWYMMLTFYKMTLDMWLLF